LKQLVLLLRASRRHADDSHAVAKVHVADQVLAVAVVRGSQLDALVRRDAVVLRRGEDYKVLT
jgi:hypothetical protein